MASHLKQPMLAEIYGSQPVWTPLRLMRAALIALVGGFVAGTYAAPPSPWKLGFRVDLLTPHLQLSL